MYKTPRHVLLMHAFAATLLSWAVTPPAQAEVIRTGAGRCMTTVEGGKSLSGLRPTEVKCVLKEYIQLRKKAYDLCGNIDDVARRSNHERCFRIELDRLVINCGNAALMEHHSYIRQVVDELRDQYLTRLPGRLPGPF